MGKCHDERELVSVHYHYTKDENLFTYNYAIILLYQDSFGLHSAGRLSVARVLLSSCSELISLRAPT